MLYKKFFKRFFDFTFSLILLLITSPIIITVSAILLFINRGKIFFIQPRPGKNGRIFRIIKFRTMNEKRDENGNLMPDNKRITRFGRFIRTSSIDELPQLLNVLKGDLSIIGPRPLLIEYLPRYNDFQKRRHEVKPGITGWAQVNGRNAISWQDKFSYDVWYVDNISIVLDIKIFYMTVAKVIKSEGINSSDTSTMEAFNGNN